MDNIYPYGECTYGAAEWAPWVLRYGRLLGDAKFWADTWAQLGGVVSSTPAAGAVACFQPGVDGADRTYGHVGGVLSVGPGPIFLLHEMNGPRGPGVFDDRTCADSPGIRYLLENAPAPAPPTAPPAPAPAPPFPGIIWEQFSVRVQVQTANVRSGPSTAYAVLRELHLGAALACDGYAYGSYAWDPAARQADHRWYHIAAAYGYGWIASAVVDGNAPGSHP